MKIEIDFSWIDFREVFDNVEDFVDDFLFVEMIIVWWESMDWIKEINLRLVWFCYWNFKVMKDCGFECYFFCWVWDLGIWNESDDIWNERGEKVILEGMFLLCVWFYKFSLDWFMGFFI